MASSSLDDDWNGLKDQTAQLKKLVDEYTHNVINYDKMLNGRILTTLKKHQKSFKELKRAMIKAGRGDEVAEVGSVLDTASRLKPATGSLFVRLMLGHVNVKASGKTDKEKLRDEYNKFKGRTNNIFLLMGFIGLCLVQYYPAEHPISLFYHTMTHVWLLYYFVTLGLRENILLVNGSNIRPWWIYHHYFSGTLSIAIILCPHNPLYAPIIPQLTYYFVWQGIVQQLQAIYQKRRHYTLKSLGKVGSMDVSATETLNEHIHRGLYILVCFLVFTQGVQLYNSYSLLGIFADDFVDLASIDGYQLQILVVGSIFAILGVMNCYNTIMTLYAKTKRKSKPKAH